MPDTPRPRRSPRGRPPRPPDAWRGRAPASRGGTDPRRGSAAARRPSTREALHRKGFRTTSRRRDPGVARCRSSRPRLRESAGRDRRRRDRGRTDSRSSRRRRRHRRCPAALSTTSKTSGLATGSIETLGAMTAREPNQSPVSAAGGGRPRRDVAEASARSIAGPLRGEAIRSIRIGPACQTCLEISRSTITPPSFSGLRIA